MQADLFGNNLSEKEEQRLNNQFIKLGDMMGDGLHHESDGKWIAAEYRKVAKQLMPEFYSAQRKLKRNSVDEKVAKLIQVEKCKCGGDLRQIRKGAKTLKCCKCPLKYQLKTIRKGSA